MLVSTVALGVAVNAGARAGSLVQVGDPAVTHNGELTFGNGTWSASASGADFTKPDPGGWAGHYTWTIPREIPAGGADVRLIVSAEVTAQGARHNACAKLIVSGFAVSGGPAGNQLCTLAEVGQTQSNDATFRLTPQSSSGSIEVQMQDGPQVHFNYASGPNTDPCASAKAECETKEVPVPAPGKTGKVSGPLAAGASTATVGASSSDGSLAGTTIVGKGSVKDEKATRGERVAACWLLGPDSVFPDKESLERALRDPTIQKEWAEAEKEPHRALELCVFLVDELITNRVTRASMVRTSAASSGCAQQVVIRGKNKRKLEPGKPKDLPKTAVKYNCAETADGGAQITAKSSNKKGLRGELGKSLDLGVVRAPDAPATDATLTFGFTS